MQDTATLSINNLSITNNGTALQNKIYEYNPLVEPSTRLTICVVLVLVGIVGFVGNILVLCFLKAKKEIRAFLRTCSFEKNFVVYIRSLAISDVLSSLISVPFVIVEINFDLFHKGWRCKLGRYLILLFPCITMNNLLVISIEKYFSTRAVPRTFRHSTVKRIVLFAWLAACLNVLLPTATFRGLRFDLNETHYTVVCRYDNQFLPFRIMYLSYTAFQYIILMILIIRINASLITTVWRVTIRKRVVNVQQDNGIKIKIKAVTIRTACIIIALTFAFIIPYLVYFFQGIYSHVTKATIDFKTDSIIRAVSALIAMANSAVNFVLYLVQMQDFRAFLRKKINSCFNVNKPKPVDLDKVEIQLVKLFTLTLTTFN